MSEERLCLNRGSWAVYEADPSADGEWAFMDTHYSDDPGTAARVVCAGSFTSGRHRVLAVGTIGAYEYEVTLETSGPIV